MANKLFQAFIDTAKTIAGYPITVANAVFMRDGSTLDEFSENIPHREDNEDTNIEVPNIDADMFNGHPADYYAKQSDLSALNTSVTQVNNKIGNTDISAIGDGTVTGGLDTLNSNLLIKGYIDKNIGDVQLNSYGYLDIRAHMPTNKTVVLAGIKTFGASASAWCFNITVDGSYIIGAGGDSISNLMIRYYYS